LREQRDTDEGTADHSLTQFDRPLHAGSPPAA
jgi:hypothetical protein